MKIKRSIVEHCIEDHEPWLTIFVFEIAKSPDGHYWF